MEVPISESTSLRTFSYAGEFQYVKKNDFIWKSLCMRKRSVEWSLSAVNKEIRQNCVIIYIRNVIVFKRN